MPGLFYSTGDIGMKDEIIVEGRGTIELSIAIRDKNGKEIGRKEIIADNGNEICEFFERNAPPRKKRKKKVTAKAANSGQVKEALDEVEQYVRDLEAAKEAEAARQQLESGKNNG